MSEKIKKQKAVRLPETEEDELSLESKTDVKNAQDFARKVGPLALGLFEAEEEKENAE